MAARLGWYWRLAATGICFGVFGLGSLLLTATAFPALLVLVRAPAARKRYAQWLISGSFKWFVGLMRLAGLFDYRVSGRERLQRRGCVVVANHPSLIDVVLLVALMPEVECIVKRELLRNPVIAAPARAAGYIGNARGAALIKKCRAALDTGRRLLIFPEGTRTRPGRPLALHRGAASIAVHAGADLLPVVILFDQTTLAKGDRWYHIPKRKLRIAITVGEPIAVASYLAANTLKPQAARQLTRDLRAYFESQLAAAGRLPEHDAARTQRARATV